MAGLFDDLIPGATEAPVHINREKVPSSARVVGDDEAVARGLYDEPGKRTRIVIPRPESRGAVSFDDLIPSASPQAAAQPATGDGPQVGTMDALGRGAMRGLTGNFYEELSTINKLGNEGGISGQGIDALVYGLYKYLRGGPEAQKRYDQLLEEENARTTAAREQHPVASTVGEIGGAIAMPVGPIANSATLPARIGRGALIGAGMGAAYGAGDGSGVQDRLERATTGGVVGAGVGAVAPPLVEGAIQGVRAAAAPAVNAVRGAINPANEASRRVAIALERDIRADPNAVNRITPQEFAASLQNNGPASIMDMGGETTRALARSAANTSPEGRGVLERTINDRFDGQTGRVVDWLRSTFHYPDAASQQKAIEQTARAANSGAYQRAYRDGAAGVWNAELDQLGNAPLVRDAISEAAKSIGNKVSSGRAMYPLNNGKPTLEYWDQVQRSLNSKISVLERAGDKEAAADAKALRSKLLEVLDREVPSFASARQGAAGFFGAENALEAGQKFVTGNFANAETRAALAKMTPQERQLFQDGFVSRFVETLEKTGDRRNVLNQIGASAAAREKLKIALGPQKAAELEAGLRVEGIMDLARGSVQGNSTTARQLAELGFAGGAAGLGGVGTYNMDPQQMTYAAVAGALLAGKRGIDTRVAQNVARLLISDNPQQLANGIRIISRSGRFMDALRAADQRIARVGGEQAPTTGLLPSMQGGVAGRTEDENPSPVGKRRD